MIRLAFAAAFAAGLAWTAATPAVAQDSKPPLPPQTEKINEFVARGWEDAPGGAISTD